MKDVFDDDMKSRYQENKPLYGIGVIVGLLLLGMLVYFCYFLFAERKEVLDNPKNNRLEASEDAVIRGSILTSDGVPMAYTEVDEEGNETRVYPYNNLFSEITGYTAVGKTNLESYANRILMTADIPLKDRILSELSGVKNHGNDLVTTIDSDLQHKAYELMEGRIGALVAMEPSTGRILAMVSNPSLDPNTVAEDWEELTSEDNTSGILLNRVSQGLYAPGSTFKIITAIAYMKAFPDTYQDFSYVCTGSIEVNGITISCDEGHVHGEVDMISAMAQSCNCAFVNMGLQLDREEFNKLCRNLGFGERLLTEIPASVSTINVNGDTEDLEMAQTSFGQGKTMESPLLNCMITAMAANGGTMMYPRILEQVVNEQGTVVETYENRKKGTYLTDEEAAYLNECLIAVVNNGTSPQAASAVCQVAGKSGTAQISSSFDNMHAWFTAYAPAEAPEIAVTVILENAGHGSEEAAPVVSSFITYYLTR